MYIGEYDRYFARSNTLFVMTRVTLYWGAAVSKLPS